MNTSVRELFVKKIKQTADPGFVCNVCTGPLCALQACQGVVLLVDPMLATGGSALAALEMLGQRGAKNVRLVCLVAAPEGLAKVRASHPDLPIVTAAVDRELDDRGYILPGLGDAGDRLYGTSD